METDLSYTLAGWREWVSLPDAGVEWIKAKLDTGARTSAIHAFDLEELRARRRSSWCATRCTPGRPPTRTPCVVESPVLDRREVRSSSGHVEERYVVPMAITLVGRTVTVEMSLSRRDEMGFRMLVGREALRQGFVVDPGRSYLGARPPVAVRRRNRGR